MGVLMRGTAFRWKLTLLFSLIALFRNSVAFRVRSLSPYAYSRAHREVTRTGIAYGTLRSKAKDMIAMTTGIKSSAEIPVPSLSPQGIPWNVSFFWQRIDHFGFSAQSEELYFSQKYIFWDEHWSGPKAGGPIFVYCGNEGPVEWFLDNAGWITEIAEEFGALVVGPEHRYYGESMPFGSAEAAYKDVASRAYLTTEQALADMAILLTSLKSNLSAENCPIVVFGGSYGGMMAAWFRLKYPHVTIGAIASSAPILQYEGVVPTDVFYKIVSHDYTRESPSCFEYIRASWRAVQELGASEDGLKKLQQKFGLCGQPRSSDDVRFWLEDAYINLAMVDYPIPADFLMPLPAYPIRELCSRLQSLPSGVDILDRVVAGIAVYFNYTGTEECFEIDADPHGESGWNFQACTEHCMPMSSNSSNSMFVPFEWDKVAFAEGCKEEFGVKPRANWITTHYGGKCIKDDLKNFGSNIIFSNGELDPWSGGGVLENISDTIVSLIIPDGAHHLDLRASTPDDPPTVLWQRAQEKRHIKNWLDEYYEARGGSHRAVPVDVVPDSGWTLAVLAVLVTATTGAMLSAILSGATFVLLLRSRRFELGTPLLNEVE